MTARQLRPSGLAILWSAFALSPPPTDPTDRSVRHIVRCHSRHNKIVKDQTGTPAPFSQDTACRCQIDRGRIPRPFDHSAGPENPSPVHSPTLSPHPAWVHPALARKVNISVGQILVKGQTQFRKIFFGTCVTRWLDEASTSDHVSLRERPLRL